MQQPRFWRRPPGLLATALRPLSVLWQWAGARRMARGPWHRLPVPVICVGNINIGGTGKTPVVIALAERLKARGLNVHAVTRGHGGTEPGPLWVDPRKHDAARVGDEPLLLAAFCDTWVARDRHDGAQAALAAGAQVILLDDGFQNPSLAKSAGIVVVDAVAGFGNGLVLPAGPLREPLETGLKRADLLLAIGPASARRTMAERWPLPPGLPLAGAELRPLETGQDWRGQKALAFAGIGHPEKFFATLRALGAEIVQAEALSDHQPLTLGLMKRLEADAFFKGALMVTTEKDATRLPEDYKLRVTTLPVRLQSDDWDIIDQVLEKAGLPDG